MLVVAISFIAGASNTSAEGSAKTDQPAMKELDVLKYEQIERLDHDIRELKEDISKTQRTMKYD